jgi:hypothetical protein
VLARELGLLLLLVAVLPVIHDPGNRRIRLRCHLDEIEVLRERIVDGVLRRLDPDLRAVLVDQSHLRGADPFVDPRLLDNGTRRLGGAPPGPQVALTKSCLLLLEFECEKTAARSGPILVVTTRLNLRRVCDPGGEEAVRSCLVREPA